MLRSMTSLLALLAFAMARPIDAAETSELELQLVVPVPPVPVRGNGRFHLGYELHITNTGSKPLKLTRVEVLGPGADTSVGDYSGRTLANLLQRVKAPQPESVIECLPQGDELAAFLWLSFDNEAAIPSSLRHRVTCASEGGREVALTGNPLNISPKAPMLLSPPLRDGPWLAANGPANFSGHRRALVSINGSNFIAQRFAIDWVMLFEDGGTWKKDQLINSNYRCYGVEALAVADGVVIAVKDGIPENVPGAESRAVPITLETIGGNHVILDLGEGRFAFYAHLQPGSLRVKVGDRVTRGQVLGLVGNSGNSTEPHLHFHLCNANSPLGSEGIPYILESFQVLGSGGAWTAEKQKPEDQPRHNEIPLLNAVVRFDEKSVSR